MRRLESDADKVGTVLAPDVSVVATFALNLGVDALRVRALRGDASQRLRIHRNHDAIHLPSALLPRLYSGADCAQGPASKRLADI